MRGYYNDKDDYLARLRRVEGQIRGLQRMVDEDQYCIDVLTQLSSVTAALQSVAVGLVDEHLRGAECLAWLRRSGDALVAESRRPHALFETTLPARWYLPADDVRMALLEPSDTVTQCPYKGTAEYWAALVDGRRVDDIAWSYRTPRVGERPLEGVVLDA